MSLPFPSGPSRLMYSLVDEWPTMIGAVAPTPVSVTGTTWTTTVGRVFPFYLDGPLTMAKVYLSTPVAGTGWRFAIYNAVGASVYDSGAITAVANITTHTPTTAPNLYGALTYYFLMVPTAASTQTMLTTPVASAATVPRWGTLAVTAGTPPASITPSSIVASTVGQPVYTVLSTV